MPGKSSTTEIRELERVTSKLRIKDAEAGDAGRYACHATNAFGTSSFNIDVTIWGKGLVKPTANGYTCLEKLTTEKCKQQAKQPEKKILKIKILWKFSLQYLS